MSDGGDTPPAPLPPQDPGGIRFEPRGRRLVPLGDNASGPMAEELLPLVRDAALELAEDGVPWANSNPDIRRRASRLVKLLDGTLEEVQGRSAGIYLASIWFGAKMEADDRARRDPAGMAEPFGAVLRVGMEELLAALPAFARQFPSALAMEDENRDFFAGVEQVAAARAVAFKAQQAELLTPEDHADLDADFAAAEAGDDPVAAKAGRVGVRSARNLAIVSLVVGALGGELVSGAADGFSFKASVTQFVVAARAEIGETFSVGPPDIRRAVELNMAKLLQPGPLPAAPKTEKQVTLVVSRTIGQGQFSSISRALEEAPEGSKILIESGVYRENIVLTKNLDLIGLDEFGPVMASAEDGAVLACFARDAVISGLRFSRQPQGSESRPIISIRDSSAVIDNCIISGPSTIGIEISGFTAAPVLRNCSVHSCSGFGIVVSDGAMPRMVDCSVAENNMGGIFVESGALPRCTQCFFERNGGPAIVISDPISGGFFANNDLRGNNLASWDIAPGAEANITRTNNLED